MERPSVMCSLCSAPGVAEFYLSGGCIAYPDLKVQVLCLHHVVKSQPRAGMRLIKDLTVNCAFTEKWNRREY